MKLLGKVQKAEYVEDTYNNEYLYFTSLKEFRISNDALGRYDPRELNLKNDQINWLSIKVDDKIILSSSTSSSFSGQFMEFYSDPNINCCSLYSLEFENQKLSIIDDRMLHIGNKILIIYDLESFFNLLDKSIEIQNYHYSRKYVTYYDPSKYNGKLTLHHKDVEFEYQKEYRILIKPVFTKAIRISIPGLKKVSFIDEIIEN